MKSALFTTLAFIAAAALVGAQPALPVNVNNPGASLTINGGLHFLDCSGVSVTVVFSSTAVGNDFDIGYGDLAAAPIPLIDDTIEINLETSTSMFGGPVGLNTPVVGLGLGGETMSFVFVSQPGIGNLNNLQGGALDPTDPDGVSLSDVCTYVVAPAVFPWTTVGDDASISLGGDPCWKSDVVFYGTIHSDMFVNSNGSVSFYSGSTDFNPTLAEWQAQMPRAGIQSDLEPNNFGTVTTVFLANGVRVDWDTAEWSTGGANGLAYSCEVSSAVGVMISGITYSGGAWGTSTVAGITNGSLGTHPGAVNFSALAGLGQFSGLASDSWIQDAGLAALPGAGTAYNFILFTNANGSACQVN